MKKYIRLWAFLTAACMGCGAWQASAESQPTQITAVAFDDSGNLLISVTGEGFDPQVRMEPAPNNQYRVVIQGVDVAVDARLSQTLTTFKDSAIRKVPAIDSVRLSSDKSSQRFELVLNTWQKLQPQVRSNNGQQIVIALVGNHQLPAAILARQQQVEETRRRVEQKRQADIAAQEAFKKAETLRQQALEKQRLDRIRLAEAHQKQLAQEAQQRAAAVEAARKKKVEAASNLSKLQQQATLQRQVFNANKPVVNAVVASTNSRQRAPIAVGTPNLDGNGLPDEPGSTTSQMVDDSTENYAQLQLAQSFGKPFSPRSLANDRMTPAGQDMPYSPSDETVTPIHLKTTPATFKPDQGNVDAMDENPDYQRVFSSINGLSLYALVNRPGVNPALLQAWQAVRDGNATGAEMLLRNTLEKYPNDAGARYLLARILLYQGIDSSEPGKSLSAQGKQRELARQELLKVLVQTPYLPAYISLLNLYLEDGNDSDAQRLWNKASAEYPDDAMVLYQQGQLSERKGDWNTARYAYLQALAKQPENPEFHYRLAQVELKTGKPASAEWEIIQALATNPADVKVWSLLGQIAETQQDSARAARYYKQAIQPDTLLRYARLLETQKQSTQALALYKAVETLAGDDADQLFSLGMTYAAYQRPDRAEAMLKRFLSVNRNPSDGRALQAQTVLKQLRAKPKRQSEAF